MSSTRTEKQPGWGPRQRFLLGTALFTGLALALQFWRIYSLTATYDQGLFLQEQTSDQQIRQRFHGMRDDFSACIGLLDSSR